MNRKVEFYTGSNLAISIKNAEVEQAIRRLAAELRVDLTEAVERAVTHELARHARLRDARLARMRSIAERIAALPLRDSRSDEEILGYDELGLSR